MKHSKNKNMEEDIQDIGVGIDDPPKSKPSKPMSQSNDVDNNNVNANVDDPPIEVCETDEEEFREITAKLHVIRRGYSWEGEKGSIEISNFIIHPKYLLTHKNNPERILEIVKEDEDRATIAVPVKSMVNQNEFAAIVEGKGNFVPDWTKKQFNAIKKDLYSRELRAKEIETLGYQSDTETDFFAFSNGIFSGKEFYPVDKFGIAEIDKKAYYVPAFSSINEDAGAEYLHEKRFIYEPSKTDFKKWNELILKVYGSNGMISVSFVIAALFRDIVFKQTNFFPLLFLFGKPQSGKSTLRTSIQHLFGKPQKEISLEGASSPKGFSRKLAQFKNGLISFEEYKNHIDKKLIGMLKNAYDGIGYERAQMTNDNKTHSSPVHSAVIVAGQEMPTKENALFTRVILLEFMQSSWDNVADFKELKELQEKGLGKVILELLSHRALFKSKFRDTYHEIYQTIKYDKDLKGIEDRSIRNIAVILAPIKVLSPVLSFAFSYDDLFKECKAKLKEQYEIMARTNEVNQFFQVLNLYRNNPKKSIEHLYKIESGIIYIRYSDVHAIYQEYAMKSDYQLLGKESMLRYLKQHSSFFKPKKGDMHTKRFKLYDKGVTSKTFKCYGFNMESIDVFKDDIQLDRELEEIAKYMVTKKLVGKKKMFSRHELCSIVKETENDKVRVQEIVDFLINRGFLVGKIIKEKLVYYIGNKEFKKK